MSPANFHTWADFRNSRAGFIVSGTQVVVQVTYPFGVRALVTWLWMLCDVSADTFCILYPLLSSIELSFVSLTFVFVCFRHNRNHYPFAAHIFGSEYCHIVVGTFKLQAQAPSAILASHMISMGAQSDVWVSPHTVWQHLCTAYTAGCRPCWLKLRLVFEVVICFFNQELHWVERVGDFPQDLEPLDYSPDRLYPKFIIRKINCGEVVFPVTKLAEKI